MPDYHLDLTELEKILDDDKGVSLANFLKSKQGRVQQHRRVFCDFAAPRVSLDIRVKKVEKENKSKNTENDKENAIETDVPTESVSKPMEASGRAVQVEKLPLSPTSLEENKPLNAMGNLQSKSPGRLHVRKSGGGISDRLRRFSIRKAAGFTPRTLAKEFEDTADSLNFAPNVFSTPNPSQANPVQGSQQSGDHQEINEANNLESTCPDRTQSLLEDLQKKDAKLTELLEESLRRSKNEKRNSGNPVPANAAPQSRSFSLQKGSIPGQVILTPINNTILVGKPSTNPRSGAVLSSPSAAKSISRLLSPNRQSFSVPSSPNYRVFPTTQYTTQQQEQQLQNEETLSQATFLPQMQNQTMTLNNTRNEHIILPETQNNSTKAQDIIDGLKSSDRPIIVIPIHQTVNGPTSSRQVEKPEEQPQQPHILPQQQPQILPQQQPQIEPQRFADWSNMPPNTTTLSQISRNDLKYSEPIPFPTETNMPSSLKNQNRENVICSKVYDLTDILTDDEDEIVCDDRPRNSNVPLNLATSTKISPRKRLRKRSFSRPRSTNVPTSETDGEHIEEPINLRRKPSKHQTRTAAANNNQVLNKAPSAPINGELFAAELQIMPFHEILDLRKRNSMGKIFPINRRRASSKSIAIQNQRDLEEKIDLELQRRKSNVFEQETSPKHGNSFSSAIPCASEGFHDSVAESSTLVGNIVPKGRRSIHEKKARDDVEGYDSRVPRHGRESLKKDSSDATGLREGGVSHHGNADCEEFQDEGFSQEELVELVPQTGRVPSEEVLSGGSRIPGEDVIDINLEGEQNPDLVTFRLPHVVPKVRKRKKSICIELKNYLDATQKLKKKSRDNHSKRHLYSKGNSDDEASRNLTIGEILPPPPFSSTADLANITIAPPPPPITPPTSPPHAYVSKTRASKKRTKNSKDQQVLESPSFLPPPPTEFVDEIQVTNASKIITSKRASKKSIKNSVGAESPGTSIVTRNLKKSINKCNVTEVVINNEEVDVTLPETQEEQNTDEIVKRQQNTSEDTIIESNIQNVTILPKAKLSRKQSTVKTRNGSISSATTSESVLDSQEEKIIPDNTLNGVTLETQENEVMAEAEERGNATTTRLSNIVGQVQPDGKSLISSNKHSFKKPRGRAPKSKTQPSKISSDEAIIPDSQENEIPETQEMENLPSSGASNAAMQVQPDDESLTTSKKPSNDIVVVKNHRGRPPKSKTQPSKISSDAAIPDSQENEIPETQEMENLPKSGVSNVCGQVQPDDQHSNSKNSPNDDIIFKKPMDPPLKTKKQLSKHEHEVLSSGRPKRACASTNHKSAAQVFFDDMYMNVINKYKKQYEKRIESIKKDKVEKQVETRNSARANNKNSRKLKSTETEFGNLEGQNTFSMLGDTNPTNSLTNSNSTKGNKQNTFSMLGDTNPTNSLTNSNITKGSKLDSLPKGYALDRDDFRLQNNSDAGENKANATPIKVVKRKYNKRQRKIESISEQSVVTKNLSGNLEDINIAFDNLRRISVTSRVENPSTSNEPLTSVNVKTDECGKMVSGSKEKDTKKEKHKRKKDEKKKAEVSQILQATVADINKAFNNFVSNTTATCLDKPSDAEDRPTTSAACSSVETSSKNDIRKVKVRLRRMEHPASTSSSTQTDKSNSIQSNPADEVKNNLINWLKSVKDIPLLNSHRKPILKELKISTADDLVFTEAEGIEYAFYNTEQKGSIGYLRFKPHQEKPTRRAKIFNLYFLVLSGQFLFHTDVDKTLFNEGSLIMVPKGRRYCIKNLCNENHIVMVIKCR